MHNSQQPPVYLSVQQLSEKYPAFSVAAIRSLIFLKKTNGFADCMRRIGRRILINEQDFVYWIESRKS